MLNWNQPGFAFFFPLSGLDFSRLLASVVFCKMKFCRIPISTLNLKLNNDTN